MACFFHGLVGWGKPIFPGELLSFPFYPIGQIGSYGQFWSILTAKEAGLSEDLAFSASIRR